MKKYAIQLVGTSPMLMHRDNIEWSDEMDRWKQSPGKQKGSKAGDDRTPAYRWIGCLYHDGNHIALPQDMIMRCMMEGGAMVPVPGAKGSKTFKAQTQSGMMTATPFWSFGVHSADNPIPMAAINALQNEMDFEDHKTAVEAMDFSLFVKRAKIGQSKHVRIRPRFDSWVAEGNFEVWDDQLNINVLKDILNYAGRYKGLGDWRPGGKTPGPYGMFQANIEEIS